MGALTFAVASVIGTAAVERQVAGEEGVGQDNRIGVDRSDHIGPRREVLPLADRAGQKCAEEAADQSHSRIVSHSLYTLNAVLRSAHGPLSFSCCLEFGFGSRIEHQLQATLLVEHKR